MVIKINVFDFIIRTAGVKIVVLSFIVEISFRFYCYCFVFDVSQLLKVKFVVYRLRAKKGPAPPPLGNFADISYLNENFKPHLLRHVCTLCSGALVSDSLLHMLL